MDLIFGSIVLLSALVTYGLVWASVRRITKSSEKLICPFCQSDGNCQCGTPKNERYELDQH